MINIRSSISKAIRKYGYQLLMKPGCIIQCIICTLFVIFVTACTSQPQTGQTDIEMQVSVRELKLSSINKLLNTSGNAMSSLTVDLNSEMSGLYQLQINPQTGKQFKMGDKVKKGQLIIRLEDREYENNIRYELRKLAFENAQRELEKEKELLALGGSTDTKIRTAETSITSARYDLVTADINLGKMNVIAPFDGVIASLPNYSENVKVASNQPMVGIMDYSRLYMDINLPENALAYVKVNQPVYITHTILPYDTLRGVITEISPAISSETRTFKGKIVIDNSQLKLRAGMFVKADVIVDRAEDAIIIPKNVLRNQQNRRFVFVVERNVAVMRYLVTGIEDDDNVEVIAGLYEGDNLIIRGYETLRDNSRVRVNR